MNEQRKVRVGIIFGGRSGEHEVSLNSARSVMAALDKDKYEIVPIGIDKNGRWLTGDVVGQLMDGRAGRARPATLLPDPTSGVLMEISSETAVSHTAGPATLSAVSQLDVVFPVLHGPYGEDGTVQGLLELANLPYVGAGVVGSAVGMDKAMFKYVMEANGLPVLPWQLVTRTMWQKRPLSLIEQLEAALRYPLFTKPANLGSSVGISKCANRAELEAGLHEAFAYDRRVVVEQGATIRELEVSVLGNEDPVASVVGEIRPRRDFYDYIAKYLTEPGSDEDSELIIPAELDEETAVLVRQLAIQTYQAVDCAGLARVDLMLDKENGHLYINEINTIPGFTRISMYPKLWEASGVTYSALLDKLIALAIARHEEKAAQRTSFELPR